MDDDYNDRCEAIEEAIRVLARGERGPHNLAVLIEAGDRTLELLACADRNELVDAGDEMGGETALALRYLAGLVLTLRQALRHHVGVHVAREPNDAARAPA